MICPSESSCLPFCAREECAKTKRGYVCQESSRERVEVSHVIVECRVINHYPLRGRLQKTSGKWGGGGFEISDIPGRGEGVVCESSDVRKFLKKSKFQKFSELFKVKTRNYNRSIFQYEGIHI